MTKNFRSDLEKDFATELEKRNIPYEYENMTLIIFNELKLPYYPFTFLKERIYTPDFYFEYEGRKIVIELKGYQREQDSYKHRFAHEMLSKQGYEFYVLKREGNKSNGDYDFYHQVNSMHKRKLTSKRSILKRKELTF